MEELALLIYANRKARGNLDFDLPEAEIVLDLQGLPENIVPRRAQYRASHHRRIYDRRQRGSGAQLHSKRLSHALPRPCRAGRRRSAKR